MSDGVYRGKNADELEAYRLQIKAEARRILGITAPEKPTKLRLFISKLAASLFAR